jgi:ribosomal protein S6E (S10)
MKRACLIGGNFHDGRGMHARIDDKNRALVEASFGYKTAGEKRQRRWRQAPAHPRYLTTYFRSRW